MERGGTEREIKRERERERDKARERERERKRVICIAKQITWVMWKEGDR
jgi:hypothetical protein